MNYLELVRVVSLKLALGKISKGSSICTKNWLISEPLLLSKREHSLLMNFRVNRSSYCCE